MQEDSATSQRTGDIRSVGLNPATKAKRRDQMGQRYDDLSKRKTYLDAFGGMYPTMRK